MSAAAWDFRASKSQIPTTTERSTLSDIPKTQQKYQLEGQLGPLRSVQSGLQSLEHLVRKEI